MVNRGLEAKISILQSEDYLKEGGHIVYENRISSLEKAM